jgi:hypothetical protein
MNRKIATAFATIAIAAGAGVATTAFAETPTPEPVFHGTATRAQVQADLAAYKQAGVNPWSTSYNPLKAFKGEKTRAQVTAEYLASRNEVAALNGEDSGSFYLAQHQGTVSPTLAGQPVNGGGQ